MKQVIRHPYFAQLVSLGGSALLAFVTALSLAPAERGFLAIFLTLSSIGGYIVCLGIQSSVLQLAASGRKLRAETILFAHIPIQFVLAAAATIGFIGLDPFVGITPELYVLSGVSIFLGGAFNNFGWYQYGQGAFLLSTLIRGLIPMFSLMVGLIAQIFDLTGAIVYCAAYVVAQLVALIIVGFMPCGRMSWRWSANSLVRSYRASSLYFFTQSEVQLLARTPVLVSGVIFSPQQTAVISIAVSLAELQGSLPQMRSAMTFRAASESRSGRLEGDQFRKAVLALLPGTVLVIISSIVASHVLPTDYRILPLYVLILTVGVAMMALAASAINILTVRQQLKRVSLVLFLGLFAAVLGMSIIGQLTVSGALLAWAISSAVAAAALLHSSIYVSERIRDLYEVT